MMIPAAVPNHLELAHDSTNIIIDLFYLLPLSGMQRIDSGPGLLEAKQT